MTLLTFISTSVALLGKERSQVLFNMTTAPFTIALGEADLESMKTNLHAHLSSGIQIAPTETCISPDDLDILTEALFNDDDERRKRPWIHRASSFRVELSIVVENTLTLIDEDLIERLACGIREAEVRSLLKQLCWLLTECSCGGS